MTLPDARFPSIVRTSSGLTVGGRRLTLYLIEDHFRAGLTCEEVQHVFGLSDKEIADVVGYIDAHRQEFDAEYERVLEIAQENRRYWEERTRLRREEIEQAPKSPQHESIRRRMEELRRQLERA